MVKVMGIYYTEGGIFIGSVAALGQQDAVYDAGVRAVLRLDTLRDTEWDKRFHSLRLPLKDGVEIPSVALSQGLAFIKRRLQDTPQVLIQCLDGYSLAVSFLLAYRLAEENLSLADALMSTFIRYPHTYPHPRQLLSLARHFDLPHHPEDQARGLLPEVLIAQAQQAISPICEGVFIGSALALDHAQAVHDQGIGAVLRLDRADRSRGQWQTDFNLLDLPLQDAADVPPTIWEQGSAFIHEQAERGVLVHCHMGVSRSAAMTLAYLIAYQGMSLPQAYQLARRGRAIIHPHPRLLRSLISAYNLPYHPDAPFKPYFWDHLRRG